MSAIPLTIPMDKMTSVGGSMRLAGATALVPV